MLVLAALVSVFVLQSSPPAAVIDVSTLKVGPSTVISEIDLGRLKGDLRRLAWSADGQTLYIQTAEGRPPEERLRHYTLASSGSELKPQDAEPDWAAAYWARKQDRAAPGFVSLTIEVDQRQETEKYGMGGGVGALDRTGSPEESSGTVSPGVDANAKTRIVRLTLLGQVVGTWKNETVVPGTRFGWGPTGSGAIVFVGEEGHLVLFDRQKHQQAIKDAKDALLPAWSGDGTRIAYFAKTGRKKFSLSVVEVGR